MATDFTPKEKTSYPDVRIEIMQALLHNSIVSPEAFKLLGNIIQNFADGYTSDDSAWEDYYYQFEDPDYYTQDDDDDSGSPK